MIAGFTLPQSFTLAVTLIVLYIIGAMLKSFLEVKVKEWVMQRRTGNRKNDDQKGNHNSQSRIAFEDRLLAVMKETSQSYRGLMEAINALNTNQQVSAESMRMTQAQLTENAKLTKANIQLSQRILTLLDKWLSKMEKNGRDMDDEPPLSALQSEGGSLADSPAVG